MLAVQGSLPGDASLARSQHGVVSRRRFLAWSVSGVGAAASVTLLPRALQAAPRLPKLSFTVISDTHLGYRDQESAARQFERLVDELAGKSRDPILHLGDVVDGGREAQYAVYRELKSRLKRPVHEIPGNHDPVEAFARHLREQVDTVVEHNWLRLVLLNNARRDSHQGFVSDSQAALIDRACRESAQADQLAAVCMHVPAHANRHPDRGWFVQPNDGQTVLYETLQRHRARVVALLHGHFHNGIRGWSDHGSLHEICFPSALYNRDRRLEAQNAPGYNLPEFRPGYTQVTIENGQMRLDCKPLGNSIEQHKLLPMG